VVAGGNVGVSGRRSFPLHRDDRRQGQAPGLHRPGVLARGLRWVRARGGSLDPVCTQRRILKIVKITGLAEVFGIYVTVG
jgi:hypothetical protein